MKELYGLLGRNISYSISPRLHNAAFKHFDMPGEYSLFDRTEDEIEEFFREIVSGRYRGLNVTVPYKIKLKKMLGSFTGRKVAFHGLVNATGSLNTIRIDEDGIYAANTDVEAFWEAVKEDLNVRPAAKLKVFVVGAGGAGRAISIYLAFRDIAERIYVYDIDAGKLDSLRESFPENSSASLVLFSPGELLNRIPEELKECDLIVNASPLGTKETDPMPANLDYFTSRAAVYDLVYARETEFVKEAKKRGLSASGGLGMLVNQAALSFNVWTSKSVEEIKNVMRDVLPGELKKTYSWKN